MMTATGQRPLLGRLKYDEPMTKHTTWRVGGVADQYYEPTDIDDLANFIHQLPADEPITMIGLGSNLLVRDKGIRGSVINMTGLLNNFDIYPGDERQILRVEAGMPCATVAKRCAKEGYTGLEFLAGIPGTVGGALAMNAGAFGGETWSHVKKVDVIDRQGNHHERDKAQFLIGYRSVIGPMDGLEQEWFVAAHFLLRQASDSEKENGAERIRKLLKKRAETQPTGVPSCGSVFRNPENGFAAKLIESCGLKGMQVGEAKVSEKHANFIINLGNATAADIERLIFTVAETVRKKTGVSLESEVRIIGDE